MEFSSPAQLKSEGWIAFSEVKNVTLYTREGNGANTPDFLAVGRVKLPPRVLWNLLRDVDSYRKFIPLLTVTQALERSGTEALAYFLMKLPIVPDRDFVVRMTFTDTDPRSESEEYEISWRSDDADAPRPQPGVNRICINRGQVLLRSTETAVETEVVYHVKTEKGQSLPQFVVKQANRFITPRMLSALERWGQDKKYREDAFEHAFRKSS